MPERAAAGARQGYPSTQGGSSWKNLQSKHNRTVSYDELHQMGLSRAVDEYHKLIVSKPRCGGMTFCGDSTEHCLVFLLKFLLLRPVPHFVRPECIFGVSRYIWRNILARIIRQGAIVLIPLAVSYWLLPDPYVDGVKVITGRDVVPFWHRFAILVGILGSIYAADVTLKCQSDNGNRLSIFSSLDMHFAGETLCMTDRQTSDLSVLQIFDSHEDIEARRKEERLINSVKSLVLRYGLFSCGEECQINNVYVAYRWISRLAEELEEDQLLQRDNFTLDSALDAVHILEDSIGVH